MDRNVGYVDTYGGGLRLDVDAGKTAWMVLNGCKWPHGEQAGVLCGVPKRLGLCGGRSEYMIVQGLFNGKPLGVS